MPKLAGKTALITGAARGIGAAIAEKFHAEGAHLILMDIQQKEGAALTNKLSAEFYSLDVSQESSWDMLEQQISKLDILVNNAGITGFEDNTAPHDPEHASLEDWHRVHRTNLDGTFLGCRFAIKKMRPNGGSIVNISSRSGLAGVPRAAAYASSKAAIRNHSKNVALYCAEEGLDIRCNSIHPGAILTPMWDAMLGEGTERDSNMKKFSHDIPAGRFGEADEVAALALLLAGDDARYINGSELVIDGGLSAGTHRPPQRLENV